MENDFQKSTFSKCLIVAVFVGFFTTILTLFYDYIFVHTLKFPLSAIINVASLIFAVNLLFFIVGPIYYVFIKWIKKGNILFIVVFVLLTIFFAWLAEGADRTADHTVNMQFRNLLAGIIIIVGISASLIIPLLFHNKKFEDYVV